MVKGKGREKYIMYDKKYQDPSKQLNRNFQTQNPRYLNSATIVSIRKKCLSKLIVHPESLPRVAWDILMLFLIIYQALTVPYYICFNDIYNQELLIIDLILVVIFFIDILLNFNTGFYSKGALIMKRRAIICDYLKIWFWVDILATFPYNWAIEGIQITPDNSSSTSNVYNTSKIIKIIRVFRFLRILRLLRLAKLKKILIKIEDYIASNTLANIFVSIRLLSMVFFIAHCTACFWFYIGSQESISHPITWLVSSDVLNRPSFEQYIISLYWAFTTISTVGYGDITPITVNEKMFAMLIMIMSSAIFAYTVGSIGSLISKHNAMENLYREQVVSVNSYMKKHDLPKSLQFRVRRYLDYIWEVKKKKKLDEKQILSLLSEPLRDEIYAHLNANVIKLCTTFDEYELYFITQLTRTLDNETYAPGDTIFEEGELSAKIYFILNGKIEIYHQQTSSIFATLGEKQFFGEIAFFIGTARSASARCIEFVDLMSLVRLNFLSLLEKFPEANEITSNLQKKCENGNYSSLSIHCYLCDEIGHTAVKCSSLLINLDQEETRKNWLQSRECVKLINIKKGRLPSFKRKERKVFKSRVTGRNVIGIPRKTLQMFPESSELYPAVHEAVEFLNKGVPDNNSTLFPKKEHKYTMFFINSDYGDDVASMQDFEKKSDLKNNHTSDSEI